MLEIKKTIPSKAKELILGIDLEWTKNYRIKHGNKPFCFSFVYFEPIRNFSKIERELRFGFELYYVEKEEETLSLANKIESGLKKFLQQGTKTCFVGHQLSSDISVLMNLEECSKLNNIGKLRRIWRERRNNKDNKIRVFDTRYDLEKFLTEKSRRLVDVCEELKLDVTQNEIQGSMTKMQNDFIRTNNLSIFEKIAVLNLRHSLSSAVLFSLFTINHKPKKKLNINRIIYNNAKNYFGYLNQDYFVQLAKT